MIWAWVAGSRLGRAAALAGAVLLAIGTAWLRGRAAGGNAAREQAREADRERADDVRDRVDAAWDRAVDDPRPADQRLRDHGRLRDRDDDLP